MGGRFCVLIPVMSTEWGSPPLFQGADPPGIDLDKYAHCCAQHRVRCKPGRHFPRDRQEYRRKSRGLENRRRGRKPKYQDSIASGTTTRNPQRQQWRHISVKLTALGPVCPFANAFVSFYFQGLTPTAAELKIEISNEISSMGYGQPLNTLPVDTLYSFPQILVMLHSS